jgi:type IV pilus assembly protein PilX
MAAHRLLSQRGASLLVTLGALVLLAISAVAILRSVDTSTLLAGNLAFRQSAVVATDQGVESARRFVNGLTAAELNNPANASKPVAAETAYPYWSVWQAAFNPETYDWDNASQTLASSIQGNSVSFVVHRMCEFNSFGLGADMGSFLNPANNCVRVVTASGCVNSAQAGSYDQASFQCNAAGGVYYRATIRSRGPRGTTSYVQVMLH